jgi:hypothetical protein
MEAPPAGAMRSWPFPLPTCISPQVRWYHPDLPRHARIEWMPRQSWMMGLIRMMPAILSSACGRVEPMPDLFPQVVAGVWHRIAIRDMAASDSPDPIPRNSVDRIQTASYEGPGKLEARVYRLTSSTVGLDVAQRWHPTADTVFFNQGRYFVVVKWQDAERPALQAFVRELERRLAPVAGLRGSRDWTRSHKARLIICRE